MGQLAHSQWVEWFAEEVVFHRVVELCLAIKEQRRLPESLARWPAYLQYLRPFHLRHALGARYHAMRRTIDVPKGRRSFAAERRGRADRNRSLPGGSE